MRPAFALLVSAASPTSSASPASAASAAPEPVPSEDAAAVPILPHNPTWGSRTARVTIVEFADFQCPYSRKVRETLVALREKYGPDDLRIVWKNYPLPFHASARPLAMAAAAVFELAGKDAFWRFHDSPFARQASQSSDSYEPLAAAAGVSDLGTLRAGIAANLWADAIDADMRDATSLGVAGTPSFFVNGVFLNGAQPRDVFEKTIDEQIAKAQAKIDAGDPARAGLRGGCA
jgi:protein-disulfide isomerase